MTRIAVMLALIFLVICGVVAFLASGASSGIRVNLSPREDDGSQVAVDFAQDLAKGRIDSAWDRTAVAFREDHDYAALAQQAKTYFSSYTRVTIQAGDQGNIVAGKIEYEARVPAAFSVAVVNEDGFWRVRKVSFGQ